MLVTAFSAGSVGDLPAPPTPLGNFLQLRKEFVTIRDDEIYKLLTVQLHARGLTYRQSKRGAEIRTKKQQVVRKGELIVAEIDAKMGGYGIVPPELDGAIVSSHYFVYVIDELIADPRYLELYLKSGLPEVDIQPYVKGSTNYAAIRQQHFPLLKIRLPSLADQRRFVEYLERLQDKQKAFKELHDAMGGELDGLLPAILERAFAGQL